MLLKAVAPILLAFAALATPATPVSAEPADTFACRRVWVEIELPVWSDPGVLVCPPRGRS